MSDGTVTIEVPGITLGLLESMFPGTKGKWREIKNVPLVSIKDITPVDLTNVDLEKYTYKIQLPNQVL